VGEQYHGGIFKLNPEKRLRGAHNAERGDIMLLRNIGKWAWTSTSVARVRSPKGGRERECQRGRLKAPEGEEKGCSFSRAEKKSKVSGIKKRRLRRMEGRERRSPANCLETEKQLALGTERLGLSG